MTTGLVGVGRFMKTASSLHTGLERKRVALSKLAKWAVWAKMRLAPAVSWVSAAAGTKEKYGLDLCRQALGISKGSGEKRITAL